MDGDTPEIVTATTGVPPAPVTVASDQVTTVTVTNTYTDNVGPPPSLPTSRFVALRPARILDTRPVSGPVGYSGPKPGPGAMIDLQVTGRGGVPTDDVTAVVFNLTATEADGAGFITAWPSGQPQPRSSSLNVDVGPPSTSAPPPTAKAKRCPTWSPFLSAQTAR